MFKWIRNKILKSIIKSIVKEMPIYKAKALALVEEHKDEIISHVKDAIKKAIREFLDAKTNSNA